MVAPGKFRSDLIPLRPTRMAHQNVRFRHHLIVWRLQCARNVRTVRAPVWSVAPGKFLPDLIPLQAIAAGKFRVDLIPLRPARLPFPRHRNGLRQLASCSR